MLDPDEDSQFKLTYDVSSSGLAIQEEQHGLQMDQQSSKTAKLEKMHKMDMLLGRFQDTPDLYKRCKDQGWKIIKVGIFPGCDPEDGQCLIPSTEPFPAGHIQLPGCAPEPIPAGHVQLPEGAIHFIAASGSKAKAKPRPDAKPLIIELGSEQNQTLPVPNTHPVIHTPPVIHRPTLIDIAKIKKQALCEGWTVMQFQLALQYAGWCKPLAIQDAGWPKPLPNYSPPISSWSSHDWSSHDWEHVHPNTIRDVDSDDPCEIAEQPDEEPGVQCEDYTIVELPAKLEGTTEVVSASSEGGSVETYDWEHVPPNTITMVDI